MDLESHRDNMNLVKRESSHVNLSLHHFHAGKEDNICR